MNRWLPQYFSVFGGAAGFVIIGCLLTLLNLFLRPLLTIISFPAKIIVTLPTFIIVNAFFLWVVFQITLRMDPDIVAFVLTGGVTGWIVISIVLGIANWILKHI